VHQNAVKLIGCFINEVLNLESNLIVLVKEKLPVVVEPVES